MTESGAEPRELVDLLGVRLAVPAGFTRLRPAFADLFAGDGVPAGTGASLELRPDDTAEDALALLTEAVVRRSPLLCIHAAVVASDHGVLAVPGQSGLGKSTLAAALTRAGLRYLSDEALALDRQSGAVTRFPRPLSLAPDVWPLLGIDAMPESGEFERQFAPSTFGPVFSGGPIAVTDILLAERSGTSTELSEGSRSDAVTALLTRSFNHFLDPAGSLRTAATVVRSARVWRARYSDATDLAERMALALSLG